MIFVIILNFINISQLHFSGAASFERYVQHVHTINLLDKRTKEWLRRVFKGDIGTHVDKTRLDFTAKRVEDLMAESPNDYLNAALGSPNRTNRFRGVIQKVLEGIAHQLDLPLEKIKPIGASVLERRHTSTSWHIDHFNNDIVRVVIPLNGKSTLTRDDNKIEGGKNGMSTVFGGSIDHSTPAEEMNTTGSRVILSIDFKILD